MILRVTPVNGRFAIPYVLVAECALRCGANLTALMYMEMRYEEMRNEGKHASFISRGVSRVFAHQVKPSANGVSSGKKVIRIVVDLVRALVFTVCCR